MTYSAVPDRRMPYDNDGTVVMQDNFAGGYLGGGLSYPSGADVAGMNGFTNLTTLHGTTTSNAQCTTWWFFPEQREITAIYYSVQYSSGLALKGSNNTTNGLDGSWETATFTAISPPTASAADQWRSLITPVSFTGPKKVVRLELYRSGGNVGVYVAHLYGSKAAGQTPDDVIYLDGQNAYAEFTSVEDFGDMPLGTTATRTFKVKNASATHTANTINIQCNDADFIISSDGVTWVTTINIASLAAGASSGVLYVRDTAPNPGGQLGPRFARIVTTVASYT